MVKKRSGEHSHSVRELRIGSTGLRELHGVLAGQLAYTGKRSRYWKTLMSEGWSLEDRILVFTPTGRDAALACQLLAGADLPCLSCSDELAVCREIAAGA